MRCAIRGRANDEKRRLPASSGGRLHRYASTVQVDKETSSMYIARYFGQRRSGGGGGGGRSVRMSEPKGAVASLSALAERRRFTLIARGGRLFSALPSLPLCTPDGAVRNYQR
uniref:Uncharacterized protein n=1 Tax=Plectus sambesii TaxID=2011161 RepID=A0A914XG26_9BILA